MSFMTWTEAMSVGVKDLDNDHKRLISYINELHSGILAGHDRKILGDVLGQLVDYTQTHFAREEELFAQTSYAAAEMHKHEHDSMVKRIVNVQNRYAGGSVAMLDLELMSFLQSWLAHHIQGMDKMYGPHFNAKGIE
jgi:hemerythrin-like metal-binding protein